MKKLIPVIFTTLAYSNTALSHVGHDHNHWSASSLHLISAVAILGTVSALVFAFKKAHKISKPQEH